MTQIDLALNHGTYCSSRCSEVFERYRSRTGLRAYPEPDNRALREALAADVGVTPEHILVGNGSGPLLKTVIPHLVEREIKSSVVRSVRYLLKRRAYPLITTRLTYSKVPAAAVRAGLTCELLPLAPDNGFRLDVDELESRLTARAGLVYLCNPNNPTGNVLIDGNTLGRLLERYPDSWFVIDEAYVHYLQATSALPALVTRASNLVVLRSFSFAYGLAAARVGFAVAPPDVVRALDAKQTPHRVSRLASDLVIASLDDDEHIGFVRETTRVGRHAITTALAAYPELVVYPSESNFLLVGTRAPWTGAAVRQALLARGFDVKVFEPFANERYDEYFRITVGLPEENAALIAAVAAIMGHDRQGRVA